MSYPKNHFPISEELFYSFQWAFAEVQDLLKTTIAKYNIHRIDFKLYYELNENGREINQELLKKIYIFREKLNDIVLLPEKDFCFLIKSKNKNTFFCDLTIYENLLNSCRLILMNAQDSIYYTKILKEFKKALSNKNPEWLIKAINPTTNEDVSKELIRHFSKLIKIINGLIESSDFKFLYNGYLAHFDYEFSDRTIKEKETGQFLVTEYKAALIANKLIMFLKSETKIFDFIIENNKDYLKI